MPSKRTIVVTAVIALMMTASGCSALQGGGGGAVDGQAVVEQAQASMENVSTYAYDMNMSMRSQQLSRPINITATAALNQTAEKLRMEMDFRGQSITQYLIGDTIYMNVGGTWQKQTLSHQNVWESQQLAQQRQLLESGSVTFVGNTTVAGQDVYELTVDVNESQVMDTIQQQQGQGLAQLVTLENVTYTVYVTHADYRLKRVDADMAMTLQGQQVDATMQMTFDFDEPVSIDLPEAATNAQTAS